MTPRLRFIIKYNSNNPQFDVLSVRPRLFYNIGSSDFTYIRADSPSAIENARNIKMFPDLYHINVINETNELFNICKLYVIIQACCAQQTEHRKGLARKLQQLYKLRKDVCAH